MFCCFSTKNGGKDFYLALERPFVFQNSLIVSVLYCECEEVVREEFFTKYHSLRDRSC